jgi:hypothetical protein
MSPEEVERVGARAAAAGADDAVVAVVEAGLGRVAK